MSQQVSILQWLQKSDKSKQQVTPEKDDEQEDEVKLEASSTPSHNPKHQQTTQDEQDIHNENKQNDDDDDDICIILDDLPTASHHDDANHNTTTILTKNDDDELQIIGTSHPNALMDFPHARQDCVTYPKISTQYCLNCYCYVCDVKASECPNWKEHHRAKKGDYVWETQRKAARRKRKQDATTNITTALDPYVDPLYDLVGNGPMSSIFQLYPQSLESILSPQRTLRSHATPLRPTQRRRRQQRQPPNPPAVNTALVVPEPTDMGPRTSHVYDAAPPMQVATSEQVVSPSLPSNDPTSIQALLNHISQNHSTMEAPQPHRFQTTLHPHQKQSLAFMRQVEAATYENDLGGAKGGWLASEVGMGKTAIILALVASDLPPLAVNAHRPKTTVVLTSVSLMGQWEDEVQKHAPHLVVRRFHPSSRSRNPIDLRNSASLKELPKIDILLSTATFSWPDRILHHVKFHRLVMDEAHLLSNRSTANINFAKQIQADRRWCVTATPFTSSLDDLKMQLTFMGISDNSSFRQAWHKASRDEASVQDINDFVQVFQKYVSRHKKSQMVGQATELPEKVYKVVSLAMSSDESNRYQRCLSKLNRSKVRNFQQRGASIFALEQGVIHPLSSDKLLSDHWKESTKLSALYHEIQQLWKQDPNLRAVVFTQYTETHRQVVQALRALFIIPVVYEITGSTTTTDRDFAIRAFQGPKRFPACMVVTLGAGSVGMTLTQASHLFLMEPCLDAAAETQAMGRIDRLGQTNSMVMKKFVFSETIEVSMAKLHSEVEQGRVSMTKSRISAAGVKILTEGHC